MDPRKISRRDFARASAVAAAAAALLPGTQSGAQPDPPPHPVPKLPAQSAAEAEARYQMILGRRGARLSAAQKADLRKAVYTLQQALDDMRNFALENADEPALMLEPRPPRGK